MLSQTEENYLKALLQLEFDCQVDTSIKIGTNRLAEKLNIKAPTVNDMLKKLKAKKLINYKKYGNIQLTYSGRQQAIEILRKHRLWETFLYEKFDFTWDEVREVAEQLEHIQSPKLIDKIEEILKYPKLDPHGQPIPTSTGEIDILNRKLLSEVPVNTRCKMVAVKDNSVAFLQYVTQLGLSLPAHIVVIAKQDFDKSMVVQVNKKEHRISAKFAQHILVVCIDCPQSGNCVTDSCSIQPKAKVATSRV